MRLKPRVGFAVVGLGLIAQGSVLPAFSHSRRAKLIALVSGDKKKAERLARKHSAKAAYSSAEFDLCLANPDVVAVYIATPPGEHEKLPCRLERRESTSFAKSRWLQRLNSRHGWLRLVTSTTFCS